MKSNSKPYRLGIALSGGGARGFAHAGALKALEEAGLRPDIIAGVSAGSVVSVLYASGMRPDDMLKIFEGQKVYDFASVKGRGSLLQINKFKKFIMSHMGKYKKLEELPIPTYLGATDFDNAQPHEFHEGDIGERMKASCSIPIVFPPVVIDGVRYVDGGLLHNLPAWIIREKCDFLIGVNCSPLLADKGGDSMLDIALRTISLMSKANQEKDMDMCDLSLELRDIAHYNIFNLKDIRKVFISGYATTKRAIHRMDPKILASLRADSVNEAIK